MKNAATNRKVLCACLGVTEARVAAVVQAGRACTMSEVMACTEAGTGCMACHKSIQAVVERHACPTSSPIAQRATG
jgi:bacterioferritin-associated ferredoxin